MSNSPIVMAHTQEQDLPVAPGWNLLPITVIVLTYNEELHIERCLRNVAGLPERLIVVDSNSTDSTIEIARTFRADVYERSFKNQADQLQWAFDNCDIHSHWVLRLDADEYLEPPLTAKIRARLPKLPPETTGISLRSKVIFRDRWIRYGVYCPSVFLRLWRAGAARIELRWMDEHAIVLHGKSITFDNDFADHDLRDLTFWADKQNPYTTRQMVNFLNLENNCQLFAAGDDSFSTQTENQPARLKRVLRNRFFARSLLYLRGALYFLYRYAPCLGFLDGRRGFVFHFLQYSCSWMLIDAKIDEARQFIALHGLAAFKEHLRTDHRIELGSKRSRLGCKAQGEPIAY